MVQQLMHHLLKTRVKEENCARAEDGGPGSREVVAGEEREVLSRVRRKEQLLLTETKKKSHRLAAATSLQTGCPGCMEARGEAGTALPSLPFPTPRTGLRVQQHPMGQRHRDGTAASPKDLAHLRTPHTSAPQQTPQPGKR